MVSLLTRELKQGERVGVPQDRVQGLGDSNTLVSMTKLELYTFHPRYFASTPKDAG